VKFWRRGRWQIPSGTSPTRRLWPRSSCSTLRSPASSPGMAPMSLLKLRSSTVSPLSAPISGGMHDLSPVFMRMIWSSVPDMLATDAGRHPPKSLLASTSTDAGELPTLSGIPEAESVGVEEDGVELAVEELWRHGALEVVVAEVQIPEPRHPEHDVGERPHEAVVAEVELVERAELIERIGARGRRSGWS
uniref:Uncharacterized protein n=1 Tax=Setaria italica TaxID=4555 RepID=A0A0Q3PIJ8_SETIT